MNKSCAVSTSSVSEAALLQATQPAGFEAYKKNAAAGGVMGMIHSAVNRLLVGALWKLCGDWHGVRSTTGVNATLGRQRFTEHEGNPYTYSLVKAMGCIDLQYMGDIVGNHECANKRGKQRMGCEYESGKQTVTTASRICTNTCIEDMVAGGFNLYGSEGPANTGDIFVNNSLKAAKQRIKDERNSFDLLLEAKDALGKLASDEASKELLQKLETLVAYATCRQQARQEQRREKVALGKGEGASSGSDDPWTTIPDP